MSGPLDELILDLYLNPDAYPTEIDPLATDFSAFEPDEPVFSAYCIKALQLVQGGAVTAADVRSSFHAAERLSRPNREYAIDLLRRVADELNDDELVEDITSAHLRILVVQVKSCMSVGPEDEVAIRKGRRIAERALAVLDSSKVHVDVDLAAEVHLALGGTYARPISTNLALAFQHYAHALRLKRDAGKATANLQALLSDMIEHAIGESIGARFLGGAGMALIDLEAAYDAAQEIGREELIVKCGLNLGEAYRGVSQAALAEPLFRSILDNFDLDLALRHKFAIELAAAISEQFRFTEALAVLEPMYPDDLDDMGWACLANCRRETGDFSGARTLFETLLENVEREPGKVGLRKIRLMILTGQAICLDGDSKAGLRLLRAGLELAKDAPPILSEDLHRNQIAAKCFLDSGHFAEARECVERACRLRAWLLENKATPQVLDSILGGYRELDFYDVELALVADGGEGDAYAFSAAESAKGRLLTWSQHRFDPTVLKAARIFDRREEELARVQQWLRERPIATRVLSLFGATRGLAVFSIDDSAEVKACWLADFEYPTVVKDVYEPWEAAVARAHDARSGLWDIANIATDHLLSLTGEWLWRAFPDLLDGGDQLIIIPHRMFRCLPLAAAQMPGGKRLADLFRQITTVPTLGMFADACQRQMHDRAAQSGAYALADPDGSLPLARLETLALSDEFEVAVGGNVTVEAIKQVFFEHLSTAIHLSCHGDFNESNAWQSTLHAVDGEVRLSDLLLNAPPRTNLVVLGACEAGKSQRSPSDEPIGFAELLFQAGVEAVVSPVWKVDDFASLLFLIEFHRRRHQGIALSVAQTNRWMRTLSVLQARRWLDDLRVQLAAQLRRVPNEDRASIEKRLDTIRYWLEETPPRERPFSRPLDWAGFQMTGLCPSNRTHPTNSTGEHQ